MKVVYKTWESGKGLEEVQARIYTQISGLLARAEEIGPRNDDRGIEATRYAFTENGKPLAYITSYISRAEPERAHIGYPWSLPECPLEVKEKLFNDLLNHLNNIDGVKKITTAVVTASKTKDEQMQFFTERGFIETERFYRYNLDIDASETAAREIMGDAMKLKSKVATEEDIPALVELCLTDTNLRNAFPDEEGFSAYFRDRVLKDGHCVMLYDGQQAVMATAPLRFKPDGNLLKGSEERYIMRFTASRPGYEFAWDRLVIELAKECEAAGLTDRPIRVSFGFRVGDPAAIGIAKMQSNIDAAEIFYVHNRG